MDRVNGQEIRQDLAGIDLAVPCHQGMMGERGRRSEGILSIARQSRSDMRQGQQNQNQKRSRGRGRKPQNQLSRSLESNGPDVKIRGTASHIFEKYQTLARDAQTSGDRIGAESYQQHAEHYYRLIMAAQAQQEQVRQEHQNRQEQNNNRDQNNRSDQQNRPAGNDRDDRSSSERQAGSEHQTGSEQQADSEHQTGSEQQAGDDKPSDEQASASAPVESDEALAVVDDAPTEAAAADAAEPDEKPAPRRRAPRRRRPAAKTEDGGDKSTPEDVTA